MFFEKLSEVIDGKDRTHHDETFAKGFILRLEYNVRSKLVVHQYPGGEGRGYHFFFKNIHTLKTWKALCDTNFNKSQILK